MIINQKPFPADKLNDYTGDDLITIFEYLFMMNPDKLDMFFDPSNLNYEFEIVSLLCCDRCIPKKFDELVEKIINNSREDLNINGLAYVAYGMYFGAISYKNSEYILRRNAKLVAFLDKLFSDLADTSFTKKFKGLEYDRHINYKKPNYLEFLKEENEDTTNFYADEYHEDIENGPDRNVLETFKILKKISPYSE